MREDIKLNELAAKISDKLVPKLEQVIEPELELDIYNLGLIYAIDLDEKGNCKVLMTFTEIACGCMDTVPVELVNSLQELPEIKSVSVEVVWEPRWEMTRISRLGRITLGI